MDLIVDKKSTKYFIEIKKSKTFIPLMAQHLDYFVEENARGFVLYNGEAYTYKKGIDVMHYSDYLD